MDVHATFGDKFNNLLNFKPSVIYALAAPSTPDSVIQQAIEKAESGEKVTVADVKDWKADYEAERQARELFAGVLENLMPMGIKTLPATERQARAKHRNRCWMTEFTTTISNAPGRNPDNKPNLE